MTNEQKKISKRNRLVARQYFGITDNSDLALHHINSDWRYNDIDRYIQWNIEDLVVMTRSEHSRLHSNNKSEETRKKLSIASTGKHPSEEARKKMSEAKKGKAPSNKGKPMSEEQKQKISNKLKGRIPWNKGRHSS